MRERERVSEREGEREKRRERERESESERAREREIERERWRDKGRKEENGMYTICNIKSNVFSQNIIDLKDTKKNESRLN